MNYGEYRNSNKDIITIVCFFLHNKNSPLPMKVSHNGLFLPGWSTFPVANIFYSFAINENQNQRSDTSPRRFLASDAYPLLLRLLFLLNFPLDLIICRKTTDADD